MIGCYTTFKKKENLSTRNNKMKIISDYNLIHGWNYELYIDVVKNNIGLESRSEFKRLKESVKNGNLKKVVVSSVNNISKKYKDVLDFLKFLEDYNCVFESIKEGKICLKTLNEIFMKDDEFCIEEEYVR